MLARPRIAWLGILFAVFLTTSAQVAAPSRDAGAPAPQRRPAKILWEISPTQTYATRSDIGPNSVNRHDSTTRLGWRVGYEFNRRTSAYWQRGNLDLIAGRVIVRGKPVYPSDGFDITDEVGVQWLATRGVSVSGGTYRRSRQCCPAASDPKNPAPIFENGAFVGAAYSFGKSYIGPLVTIYDQSQFFNHKLSDSVARTVPRGGFTGRAYLPVTGALGITVRIPVLHQRKIIPYLNYAELGAYYNGSTIPGYATIVESGLTYTPSRLVTYTATTRNLTQYNQGSPFPSPEAQRYSWLRLTANFHGRL